MVSRASSRVFRASSIIGRVPDTVCPRDAGVPRVSAPSMPCGVGHENASGLPGADFKLRNPRARLRRADSISDKVSCRIWSARARPWTPYPTRFRGAPSEPMSPCVWRLVASWSIQRLGRNPSAADSYPPGEAADSYPHIKSKHSLGTAELLHATDSSKLRRHV